MEKKKKYSALGVFIGVVIFVAILALGKHGAFNSETSNAQSVSETHDEVSLPAAPQSHEINLVKVQIKDTTNVIAKGVNAGNATVVPGAVLCSNYDDAEALYTQYTNHWSDAAANIRTGGRSELIHGQPAEEPQPSDYNCVLVPVGTPMDLDTTHGAMIVRAHMLNGDIVTGVTLGTMFENPPETLTQKEADEKRSAAIKINSLLADDAVLTKECQDAGSDPNFQACGMREGVDKQLVDAGWCHGVDDPSGGNAQWTKCDTGSSQ